jgi:hypothetical protein
MKQEIEEFEAESTLNVLDFIYELTGLSVSIYMENIGSIYSENYWPKYCQIICQCFDSGVCSELFPMAQALPDVDSAKSGNLIMCKAGLWHRIIPLRLDDGSVAYFSIGHRRVKERDKDSRNQLKKLLYLYEKTNRIDRIPFLMAFEKIKEKDEAAFYHPIFDDLSPIEKHIKKERLRNEKSREMERKQAARLRSLTARVAHQLHLPIQALIGEASFLGRVCHLLNWHSEIQQFLQAPYVIS